MGCFSGLSLTLIFTSSVLYALAGAGLTTIGILALVLSWTKAIVPTWMAGVTLGVGIAIILFAIFGFAAFCKKERKCPLSIFMIFTLVTTMFFTASAVVLFQSSFALEAAKTASFVNLTEWERGAANQMKNSVVKAWDTCIATVEPVLASPGEYQLACQNVEMAAVQDAVNSQCLGSDGFSTDADYYQCFTSNDWWPMPAVDPSDMDAVLDTPKGLFCACHAEFVDFVEKYFVVGKWVSVGLTIFFGLVFFSCCYLCCCAEKKRRPQQETKGAYLARP